MILAVTVVLGMSLGAENICAQTIQVASGKRIVNEREIRSGQALHIVVESEASCEILVPISAKEIVLDGLGILTLGGGHGYAGKVTVNEGTLIIASSKTLDARRCQIRPSYGVIVGFNYPVTQLDIGMIAPDQASAFTLALGCDTPNDLDFSVNTGLLCASLGALSKATYTGKLIPSDGIYRLGGGGGTLSFAGPLDTSASLMVGGFFAPAGKRIYWEPKDLASATPRFSGMVVLPESAPVPKAVVVQNGVLKVGSVVWAGTARDPVFKKTVADSECSKLQAPVLESAVGSSMWVELEWKNMSRGSGTMIQQSDDGQVFTDAKSTRTRLTRNYVYIPKTQTTYFRIATLDADNKPGPWSNVCSASTDATADIEKILRHRFQLDDGSRVFNPTNPAVRPYYSEDDKQMQSQRGLALIADFGMRVSSDMTYTIPAGIYRVPGGAMRLQGVTNTTVKAANVTFILDGVTNKSAALFAMESCKDVIFEGPMTLTTDLPRYSTAKIIGTDATQKTVDLNVLDGYSLNVKNGKDNWYLFDEQGRMITECGYFGVKTREGRKIQIQGSNWAGTSFVNRYAAMPVSEVPEYQAFALPGHASKRCANMTFKDVTCYGFGAPAMRVEGYVKYINYRVLPQPGTTQLFCSWPGQFGLRDSAVIFDGCEFNTGGDDGINLMTSSGMALGQFGPRTVVLFRVQPIIGELIRFYDYRTLALLGEARVVSSETIITPSLLAAGNYWLKTNRCGRSAFKEAYRVTLDQDVRIGWYAQAYAPENGASDLVVRNCYWRDMFAQAILAQTCKQGVIADNLFERSTAHAIALSSSSYWQEGYWPNNVAVRNNVIRDNSSISNRFSSSSIVVGTQPAVFGTTLGLIENCDIEGNRIYNSAYSAIQLNYGKNCRVVRNELVNSGVMDSNSAAIKISGGEQVEVRDNVIRYGASGARTWMTFAPDVRRENVSISGNRVFDDSGREETAPLFPYLYGSDGRRALWLRSGGAPAETFAITLDPARGLEFEGIGALSAGASSRLLMDCPEPQRSEILDLLFKPGYAAAPHRFKVKVLVREF